MYLKLILILDSNLKRNKKFIQFTFSFVVFVQRERDTTKTKSESRIQ